MKIVQFKKTFAFVLTVCMLLSLFVVSASAENTLNLKAVNV